MTDYIYNTCKETHDWHLPEFKDYYRPLTLTCGRCSGKRIVQEGEMLPENVWEKYEKLKEYITLKNRGYMK